MQGLLKGEEAKVKLFSKQQKLKKEVEDGGKPSVVEFSVSNGSTRHHSRAGVNSLRWWDSNLKKFPPLEMSTAGLHKPCARTPLEQQLENFTPNSHRAQHSSAWMRRIPAWQQYVCAQCQLSSSRPAGVILHPKISEEEPGPSSTNRSGTV